MKTSNHGVPGFDPSDSVMEAVVAGAVLLALYGALAFEMVR